MEAYKPPAASKYAPPTVAAPFSGYTMPTTQQSIPSAFSFHSRQPPQELPAAFSKSSSRLPRETGEWSAFGKPVVTASAAAAATASNTGNTGVKIGQKNSILAHIEAALVSNAAKKKKSSP